MTTYVYTASKDNQQTPVLKKGKVKIYSDVSIFWSPGQNPTATPGRSSLLSAGETKEIRLPVSCTKIAFVAAGEPGKVIIREIQGGAKASCSA